MLFEIRKLKKEKNLRGKGSNSELFYPTPSPPRILNLGWEMGMPNFEFFEQVLLHSVCNFKFNLFKLANEKNSLTILTKTFKWKDFWESILRKNIDQNIKNNPPSNILLILTQFQSSCQKYLRFRRQFAGGTTKH